MSLGFFLLLAGILWVTTPGIVEEVKALVNPVNWHLTEIGSRVFFPEPDNSYPVFYSAASYFCLVFGIVELAISGIRLAVHQPKSKIGGGLSGVAFWLGLGYFFGLLANNTIGWFGLVAGFFVFLGLSMVIESVFRLV